LLPSGERFGIETPCATQRATLQKDDGSYSGAIVQPETLNVEKHSLLILALRLTVRSGGGAFGGALSPDNLPEYVLGRNQTCAARNKRGFKKIPSFHCTIATPFLLAFVFRQYPRNTKLKNIFDFSPTK